MAELQLARAPEALRSSMACLKVSYLASRCHARKAEALLAMKLPAEAREVVNSGLDVVDRARDQAFAQEQRLRAQGESIRSDVHASLSEKISFLRAMADEGEPLLRKLSARLN